MSLSAQSAVKRKENEKTLHPPPIVNFYITGLCYGDTTYFISKTNIGDISWAITNDKGDTLYLANTENAKYYFKKKGYYNICQTADNGHIAFKIRTVLVDTITNVGFYYRKCINEFDNTSTCADQFVWTFPNNTTSTDTFPTYQFKNTGKFPVKLVVKKGNKTKTLTQMISLPPDSVGIPEATFTFKRHGNLNIFDFKAVDSLADNYNWSFGDIQFDDTSGYKVTHTFDMKKYNGLVSLRVQNGCGFTSYETDPFTVTGIFDEYFLIRNVSIYPNPASDEVNIAINNLPHPKTVVIKLIDIKGSVLQEEKFVNATASFNTKFNTSSLSKGMYLIQLTIDDQLLNKKIIVQ